MGTSERTALTVAQVYLDVLARREMVRLAEDNLRNHERILDQISCVPAVVWAAWPTSTRPRRVWPRRATT